MKNRPPKRKKSRPKMKQTSQRRKAIVDGSEYTGEGGWRCEWVRRKNTLRSDEIERCDE